jgi:hypothetical protein
MRGGVAGAAGVSVTPVMVPPANSFATSNGPSLAVVMSAVK